jgi:hypothetical protein
LVQRARSDGMEPPGIVKRSFLLGKLQLVSCHNLAIIPQG